jgi:hypothetical protein
MTVRKKFRGNGTNVQTTCNSSICSHGIHDARHREQLRTTCVRPERHFASDKRSDDQSDTGHDNAIANAHCYGYQRCHNRTDNRTDNLGYTKRDIRPNDEPNSALQQLVGTAVPR